MVAASSTSSTRRAICSAPISTIDASSRSSLDVALVDSRPAAPTTAFSWLRTWWPKSASSSASSMPGFGEPFGRGASSIALASFSNPLMSAQLVSRRLFPGREHRIRHLDPVGDEMRQEVRPGPGRGVVAGSPAVGRDADLAERKDLLQGDLAFDHAKHFGHADNLARPSAKALGLDDDVDGGRDLAADRARRKLGAGKQHQRLEPID